MSFTTYVILFDMISQPSLLYNGMEYGYKRANDLLLCFILVRLFFMSFFMIPCPVYSGYVHTLVTNPTSYFCPYIFISSGYTANCDTSSSPLKQPNTSALSSTGNFDCFISSSFQPVSASSASVT